MPIVDVLTEILVWSESLPAWQRDALRRLVVKGELTVEDLDELASICKASFGLAEKCSSEPLAVKYLPERGASMEPLRLKSLTHHDGVNALAKEQTLNFGSSITVVYGGNAAGKSGYTRILKKACRARGAEAILGNVVLDVAPGRPQASIQFDIGAEHEEFLWGDDGADSVSLGRISVFDRHCASVYIAEKTDVAFRPLGLDLFDKLSDACEALRNLLEKERKQLFSPTVPIVANIPEGTAVDNLISHITSLTDADAIKVLAEFTTEDASELEGLRVRLRDTDAEDPVKEAKVLDLRARRMEWMAGHVAKVTASLTDDVIRKTFEARNKMEDSARLSEQMRSNAFDGQPLLNTGSEAWRELWSAAKRFSDTGPYSEQMFPVTEADARCVLCQQELSDEASERLLAFKKFLESALQIEHDKDVRAYRQYQKRFAELVVTNEESNLALDELKVESPEIAEVTGTFLVSAEARCKAVLEAIDEEKECPSDLDAASLSDNILAARVTSLKVRSQELREGKDDKKKEKLQLAIAELAAREQLSENVDAVLNEITRQKKIAAYQLAFEETKTNKITRKSSDITERAVTKQLAKSFASELDALRFKHVEVELTSAGGARGSLFHKLQLKRAPGVSVPKVVSEGEARCLSIASFFAELSTTADRSAILFDDPVSSLDHNWRENVARRLAHEAQKRQVIVFTHDIVFLLSLVDKADELGVDLTHQYLRRDKSGAGVTAKQLPWVAMKVKSRIGFLKELYVQAEKQYRTGNQSAYEFQATTIYGMLREAWERAVEEVLIGGVVERYRKSVETQRASCLCDITEEDCTTLEAAMTKTSRWLPGHDQASAENAPFPEPDELKNDIQGLQDWVDRLRPRRK
ncbi:AAA family ATPase [Stieleria marina]|uniref:DNA replication and repair protein RecF n=1 Tax=Stieleria marina TaxID=1930275 RepID=A0A517P221_9BACT|nr:DNA replication and repair protein RecF [Planctomycetes bacterium K23_9]